jgi:type II secretory pathway pseudopilin PulG
MNIFLPKKQREQKGFTLVEMVIYLAMMVVITVALIRSLVVVFASNRASFADSNIRNSAYSAMESMIEQIRASQSIDMVDSVLAPSQSGVLELNQVDNVGNPYLTKFSTSSAGALNLSQGSTTPSLVGPVTYNGTKVTSLMFTPINTGDSQSVRIQMQLTATQNNQIKTMWFYDTIVLRDSY